MKTQKRIHLITLAAFPYSSAESIHLAMFSKAMASLCDYTLVTPVKAWRPRTFSKKLASYYGIANNCFRQTKYLQLLPSPGRFLKCALGQAKKSGAIVYARQSIVAQKAIEQDISIMWEVHELPTQKELNFIGCYLKSRFFLRIVVISNALKEEIVNQIPAIKLIANKIIVAPDAADPEKFQENLNLLDRTNKSLRIGYVGSGFEGKGLEVIVPLAERMGQLEFDVYGVCENDPNLKRFSNIPKNINWHGKIKYSKVIKEMAGLDIALLPNQPNIFISNGVDIGKYTSPMKMFEYMAAEKAIIASDLPILREVLINNKNCLLVKHDDIDGWKNAIHQLMDSELRAAISRQARVDFMEKYTYVTRAKKIIELASYD